MDSNVYKTWKKLIDNNSMYPEDWEDLIFSDLDDYEVLVLILIARGKFKE